MSVLLAVALLLHTVGDEPDFAVPVEPVVEEEVAPPEPAPLSPREYLFANYANARKLDCVISHESTWRSGARSGPYVGLAQFDYATWMETPQGKAGMSRTDPYASIDALAWGWVHLGPRRWPRTSRLC